MITARTITKPLAKRIFLVACVSKKQQEPRLARDLYCSTWFIKARRYVETTGEPWYILSARYGLVTPDQCIAPYDSSLIGISAPQRRAWAKNVVTDVLRLVGPGDHVVLLAGERYREFVMPALTSHAINVSVPLKHLGIGDQLKWLAANAA